MENVGTFSNLSFLQQFYFPPLMFPVSLLPPGLACLYFFFLIFSGLPLDQQYFLFLFSISPLDIVVHATITDKVS